MTKKIVALAGDGIGPEIMEAGLEVLEALAEKTGFDYEIDRRPFGGAGIDAAGHPLPDETLKACREADAILLAAIGSPQYDGAAVRPEQGLLALRKELNLYANIRPVKIFDSLKHLSPLKAERIAGVDFVVVRELTGGITLGTISLKSEKRVISTTIAMRKWSGLFARPLKSQEIAEKSLPASISKMF